MLFAAVKNLPKTQAIVGTISGVFALSYVCWAADRYSGKDYGGAAPGEPHTTSAEWQAASVEYAKAQKANPIRHFRE
ncbi:hypothetical protein Poli38472_012429 [Pythium oligandrum]|uniref:Uncharacterized protein n=1 Tax=Pythium oligandrum TaxID=41045 RepID=A0A8K1CS44_PYTOL|nr:hypothetical protein Poli38472_012429 [Pythium oligandrum]|eukprot:TMW67313.1 hypothetical protein Poli38472_012429 [Pythium oligandrum]